MTRATDSGRPASLSSRRNAAGADAIDVGRITASSGTDRCAREGGCHRGCEIAATSIPVVVVQVVLGDVTVQEVWRVSVGCEHDVWCDLNDQPGGFLCACKHKFLPMPEGELWGRHFVRLLSPTLRGHGGSRARI